MAIQRLDGLPSAYAAGANAASLLHKVADAAANTYCNIYRANPGFILSPSIFRELPGMVPFYKGLNDSLCQGRGALPPAPAPQLTGGQCACVSYDITLSQRDNSSGNVVSGTISRVGAIGGIKQRDVSTPTAPNRILTYLLFNVGCNGSPGLEFGLSTAPAGQFTHTITAIKRSDNKPDTCGQLPPEYPDTIPSRDKIYRDVTIVNNDGTNLTIPFVYAPITPTLNLSPNIRIDLGGFALNFDLGGVNITFPDPVPDARGLPPSGGYPSPPPNALPPSPSPTSPPPDYRPGNKDDCPPCNAEPQDPTPPDETSPPESKPPDDGKEQDKPGLSGIEVILTKLPDKVHYGNGGQNAVFAGWVAFRAKSGSYYERQQINFQKSIFPAPAGAVGYTYTLTNGAEGFVREYTKA